MPTSFQFLILLAAFFAGGVNSIAGGGTLLTFTSLGLQLPLKIANATNAAALAPAGLSSALAFLPELKSQWKRLIALLIPTALGSYLGAVGLINTSDELFRRIVPFLVLFAVGLFGFRDHLNRWTEKISTKKRPRLTSNATSPHERITPLGYVWGIAFQFIIGLYGGYFGAGIGILMISSFSSMGMRDIHRMNAIKNPLAVATNGIAAIKFATDGLVRFDLAIPMAIAAILGSYLIAKMSRHINQRIIRAFVVAYGCVVAAYLFARYWLGWLT
jgi:hypothetical protein